MARRLDEDLDPSGRPPDRAGLLRDLEGALRLYQEGRFAEAKSEFASVLTSAGVLGIRSAHANWALAITLEALGEFDGALHHISEAQVLDPLVPQIERSAQVIAERARARLKFNAENNLDDQIEPLYRLLLRYEAADVPSHLIAGRFLVRSGRAVEAVRILEAVTVLNPANLPAWAALEAAAREAGDLDLATRAKFEAACGMRTATDSDEIKGRALA